MRLATISHSHIALRQQLFFQEVARQGDEVIVISPGEWFDFRAKDYDEGSFHLRTCRHIGDNIYMYKLLGAKELVEEFKPDWLYVQAEPGSLTADEALDWKVDKRALFTWENVDIKGNGTLQLPKYDLVICGNPEAEALVKMWNPHTALMLQVGVPTDHFQARPRVSRNIEVAYIGRPAPEKGVPYLMRAWPTARVLPWTDFKDLPWRYSQVKVVVSYSQDIPEWKEQAPNYVVLEALSCGCRAVVSDTAAMKYWLEGCPGVTSVELNSLWSTEEELLRRGIKKALDADVGDDGRDWVIDNFSNPIMAGKLLEVLEHA